MDHGSMTMDMTATTTTGSAVAAATTAAMDMGGMDHGGMDHGGGMGGCQISVSDDDDGPRGHPMNPKHPRGCQICRGHYR